MTFGRVPSLVVSGGWWVGSWWRENKQVGFHPGFVSDVDAVLAQGSREV